MQKHTSEGLAVLPSGSFWPTYAVTIDKEFRVHDTKAEERLFHFRNRVPARCRVDAGSRCTARQHRFFLFPFRDRQGEAGKSHSAWWTCQGRECHHQRTQFHFHRH